jgi:hypothetical protein
MVELSGADAAQIHREEKKVVDDTERAGGTVHEFNPDATPQQKAAAVGKVGNCLRCSTDPRASQCPWAWT